VSRLQHPGHVSAEPGPRRRAALHIGSVAGLFVEFTPSLREDIIELLADMLAADFEAVSRRTVESRRGPDRLSVDDFSSGRPFEQIAGRLPGRKPEAKAR
jgi:hypothetical protein